MPVTAAAAPAAQNQMTVYSQPITSTGGNKTAAASSGSHKKKHDMGKFTRMKLGNAIGNLSDTTFDSVAGGSVGSNIDFL